MKCPICSVRLELAARFLGLGEDQALDIHLEVAHRGPAVNRLLEACKTGAPAEEILKLSTRARAVNVEIARAAAP